MSPLISLSVDRSIVRVSSSVWSFDGEVDRGGREEGISALIAHTLNYTKFALLCDTYSKDRNGGKPPGSLLRYKPEKCLRLNVGRANSC